MTRRGPTRRSEGREPGAACSPRSRRTGCRAACDSLAPGRSCSGCSGWPGWAPRSREVRSGPRCSRFPPAFSACGSFLVLTGIDHAAGHFQRDRAGAVAHCSTSTTSPSVRQRHDMTQSGGSTIQKSWPAPSRATCGGRGGPRRPVYATRLPRNHRARLRHGFLLCAHFHALSAGQDRHRAGQRQARASHAAAAPPRRRRSATGSAGRPWPSG